MIQYPFSLPYIGLETIPDTLAMRRFSAQQLSSQLLALNSFYNSLGGFAYLPRNPSPQVVSNPLIKTPFYQAQELTSQKLSSSDADQMLKSPPSPDSESNSNFSKHCLKFCRKLSSVILENIKSKSNLFISSISFCTDVSKVIFKAYQLPEPSSTEYTKLVTSFFVDMWSKFKAQMSYSHNKGICIVKSEDWSSIFDKKTMIKNFQRFASTLEAIEGDVLSEYLQDFNNSGLVDSLGRVIYNCSMILVLAVILKDNDPKAKYLRTLEKIENFLTLAISPAIYKNYNHRSGKFAVECCGKCKVCCSKTIPPDFEKELETSRKKKDMIKSFIEVTITSLSGLTKDQTASLYGFVSSYL